MLHHYDERLAGRSDRSDRNDRMTRVAAQLAMPIATLTGLVAMALLARDTFDPLARERAALELARQQQINVQLASYDVFLAAAWRTLPLALAAGAGLVALVLIYRRWADVAAVQAHYAVQVLAARYQVPVPHTLTYSPHTSQTAPRAADVAHEAQASALTALGAPVAAEPVRASSFAELLEQNEVGKGNPLLLGVDLASGEQVHGSWLDLYSTAVAGLPGQGKTTSQRFLAAQSALHGARFVVCDPHAGAADDSLGATLDPLRSTYLCDVADNEAAILDAVRYVADIGEKRIHGQDDSRTPVILWLDEATRLLAHSKIGPELGELLERIAQQYRKRFVYASISGQIWTADRSGGSALRDSLASVLAHRMKRNQARLILPTAEAQQVERLEPGRALLWSASGTSRVLQIPNTTSNDIRRVAGLLTADAPAMPRLHHVAPTTTTTATPTPAPVAIELPTVSQTVAVADAATIPLGSPTTASPEAARAAALFLGGMTKPADLVRELRGVSSNQGSKYQQALIEVMELVRQGIQ